jgi:hypothetical protein
MCQHAVDELVLAVIGEDEAIDPVLDIDWALIETSQRMGGVKPFHFKSIRNNHREEQRQQLKGEQ